MPGTCAFSGVPGHAFQIADSFASPLPSHPPSSCWSFSEPCGAEGGKISPLLARSQMPVQSELRGKAQGGQWGILEPTHVFTTTESHWGCLCLSGALRFLRKAASSPAEHSVLSRPSQGPELCTNGWQMQSSFSGRLPHCRGTGSTEAVVCTCHSCPVQSKGLVGHSCP